MNLHVFLFLFMLSLAQLCHLYWSHHCSPRSRAAAKLRTRVQRLLKPRSPLSSGVEPAPLPVRPWREMKSRRGAPRASPVLTESAPTPASQTLTFMRLFGDGKHGHAERIQTFRGPACRTTFSARCHTPLYRLKTTSQHIGMVRISREPQGWTLRLPSVSQGYRQATITSLSDARGLACANLARALASRNLQLPHLRLDELRTRLRSYTQVLWLWLAIDPCTKILPVLHLGPRTQNMAHLLIHSLRRILAAFLPPTLHE
jgi:hypothetical protein